MIMANIDPMTVYGVLMITAQYVPMAINGYSY